MYRFIVLTSLFASGLAAAQQAPVRQLGEAPAVRAPDIDAPAIDAPAVDAGLRDAQADSAGDTRAVDEPEAEARVAAADDAPPAPAAASGGVKTLSGMSVLGNEEAPKSLVIVPWRSSQLGDGLGVTNSVDERARPVDKEVFMREVHYYGLRSGEQG
jgi:hypothetical protein